MTLTVKVQTEKLIKQRLVENEQAEAAYDQAKEQHKEWAKRHRKRLRQLDKRKIDLDEFDAQKEADPEVPHPGKLELAEVEEAKVLLIGICFWAAVAASGVRVELIGICFWAAVAASGVRVELIGICFWAAVAASGVRVDYNTCLMHQCPIKFILIQCPPFRKSLQHQCGMVSLLWNSPHLR